jgi:CUB domain
MLLKIFDPQVIYLKFTDFVIGTTDSLRIYDGDNTTASLIADLRGTYSVLPGSFLSTQEFMLLELTTSSGIQERHFNATYSSRSFGTYRYTQADESLSLKHWQ